ncbi:hypothetical protein HH310_19285 [Actinoplanes sp. TBRC 11911]|uniref:hypothetical protein n=1 Tax=Actinoplanes sp. TBRC 11911 TaxID=2729386 RepID=UPI00145E8F04|nr:hypothetical protein [Actinoplanes sp. TBRC 11911]NMO53323.1 hypothetical protein [Actinoplanes sp. TBRC 11911]
MSWQKGADEIQSLIDKGYLEQVPANPDEAAYLIDKARLHLQTARNLAEVDPEIAYDALYAAARKALTAVLPPAGPILRPYRRLRRVRGAGDYQASEGAVHPDDVERDLPAAERIVDAAAQVVPQMPVFTPRRR